MEKTFTFRFYDISREKDSIPAMVDMFRQVAQLTSKVERERQLSTDYVVRLENLEDDGADAVVGELVRCQRTNLPSEVSADGRKILTAERLGHSVVFRLNHKTGAFGIQHDPRIISPGRVLDYLSAFNPSAIYSMAPKINEEAWAKFNAGGTRKLAFRIANPENLEDLSGTGKAASSGIKSMADAYDAPSILVEISMGHHKGFLSTAVHGLAKQMLNLTGARLDKLSAVTVVNDEREEIDLIEDRIVSRGELEIHDRDPEINWKVKRSFLCAEMKKVVG